MFLDSRDFVQWKHFKKVHNTVLGMLCHSITFHMIWIIARSNIQNDSSWCFTIDKLDLIPLLSPPRHRNMLNLVLLTILFPSRHPFLRPKKTQIMVFTRVPPRPSVVFAFFAVTITITKVTFLFSLTAAAVGLAVVFPARSITGDGYPFPLGLGSLHIKGTHTAWQIMGRSVYTVGYLYFFQYPRRASWLPWLVVVWWAGWSVPPPACPRGVLSTCVGMIHLCPMGRSCSAKLGVWMWFEEWMLSQELLATILNFC